MMLLSLRSDGDVSELCVAILRQYVTLKYHKLSPCQHRVNTLEKKHYDLFQPSSSAYTHRSPPLSRTTCFGTKAPSSGAYSIYAKLVHCMPCRLHIKITKIYIYHTH
jgi:hypothetical protein